MIPERYNFIGSECKTCGEKFFPSRAMCPVCRRKGKIEDKTYSGRGEVFSYTVVHVPPEGFELQAPYAIVIVKLEEGPNVLGMVTDCNPDSIQIGTKVEAVFRKILADGDDGIIEYGHKFRPVFKR